MSSVHLSYVRQLYVSRTSAATLYASTSKYELTNNCGSVIAMAITVAGLRSRGGMHKSSILPYVLLAYNYKEWAKFLQARR